MVAKRAKIALIDRKLVLCAAWERQIVPLLSVKIGLFPSSIENLLRALITGILST